MMKVEMEWREEIGEARREWWESEQNSEAEHKSLSLSSQTIEVFKSTIYQPIYR